MGLITGQISSKFRTKLAWSNPNSSVAFPSQTIQIPNLKNYGALVIIYKWVTGSQQYDNYFCLNIPNTYIYTRPVHAGAVRRFTLTSNSIKFLGAEVYSYDGITTADNTYLIPDKIYLIE